MQTLSLISTTPTLHKCHVTTETKTIMKERGKKYSQIKKPLWNISVLNVHLVSLYCMRKMNRIVLQRTKSCSCKEIIHIQKVMPQIKGKDCGKCRLQPISNYCSQFSALSCHAHCDEDDDCQGVLEGWAPHQPSSLYSRHSNFNHLTNFVTWSWELYFTLPLILRLMYLIYI